MMLFNEAKTAISFININDKNGYESSVQLLKKKCENCKNRADKELVRDHSYFFHSILLKIQKFSNSSSLVHEIIWIFWIVWSFFFMSEQ